MLLTFEAEAKSLIQRPRDPKAKARGYEAKTKAEAKILASRPVLAEGFNMSVSLRYDT